MYSLIGKLANHSINFLLMKHFLTFILVFAAHSAIIIKFPTLPPPIVPIPADILPTLPNLITNGDFLADKLNSSTPRISINKLTGWNISQGFLNLNGQSQNISLISIFKPVFINNVLGVVSDYEGISYNQNISQIFYLNQAGTCEVRFNMTGKIILDNPIIFKQDPNMVAGAITKINDQVYSVSVAKNGSQTEFVGVFRSKAGINTLVISSNWAWIDPTLHTEVFISSIMLRCK